MGDVSRDGLFAVLLATLRPIASMLLRFGVSYRDFDLVCRAAFVEAATEDHSTGGKQANISRVSLVTGLSRKAVRLVQEQKIEISLPQPDNRSLPAEVLHVWHTNSRFSLGAVGARDLDWDTGANSFTELVRLCSSTVSPASMCAELLRVGAIQKTDAGLLAAKRRAFVPSTSIERLIQGLQYGIRPLALTVAHNAAADDSQSLRFQRIVWNNCPPKEQRVEIERVVKKRLEEFSQEIDDLLSEASPISRSGPSSVFGVGLYHFEDDPNDMGSKDS